MTTTQTWIKHVKHEIIWHEIKKRNHQEMVISKKKKRIKQKIHVKIIDKKQNHETIWKT